MLSIQHSEWQSRGARVREDYDLSRLCCGIQQRVNKASVSVTKSAGFCFESSALGYAADRKMRLNRKNELSRQAPNVTKNLSYHASTAGGLFF